jgi:hypothetical protein
VQENIGIRVLQGGREVFSDDLFVVQVVGCIKRCDSESILSLATFPAPSALEAT